MKESVSASTSIYVALARAVDFILWIIGLLLMFRFLLRLLSANPNTPFVNLIYSLSYPLVAPFDNMFALPQINGFVIDWSVLFALIVYSAAGYGLKYLASLVIPPTKTTVVKQEL